jgi:hypothetical protein
MKTINPPASGSEKGAEPKLSQEAAPGRSWNSPSGLWHRKTTIIAALSIVAILLHLVLRFGFHTTRGTYQIPLLATLALGGLPLLYDLLRKLLKLMMWTAAPSRHIASRKSLDKALILNKNRMRLIDSVGLGGPSFGIMARLHPGGALSNRQCW